MLHVPSRQRTEEIDSRGGLFFRMLEFISIPQAAGQESDAPVPADLFPAGLSRAQAGRAPSHRKHGPPESALICDTDPHGKTRVDWGKTER